MKQVSKCTPCLAGYAEAGYCWAGIVDCGSGATVYDADGNFIKLDLSLKLDPAIAGVARAGHCRAGIYKPKFEQSLEPLRNTPFGENACSAGTARAGMDPGDGAALYGFAYYGHAYYGVAAERVEGSRASVYIPYESRAIRRMEK